MMGFIDDKTERYGGRKVFIALCSAIIAIFIAFTIIASSVYFGYTYKGSRLRLAYAADLGAEMTDASGNRLVMTRSGLLSPACEIAYMDERIVRQAVYDGAEQRVRYTFSDGSSFKEPLVRVVINGEARTELSVLSENQIAEIRLIERLEAYINKDVTGFTIVSFALIGLLFILLGTWSIVYPRALWRFHTFLTVEGGEPTAFALLSNRIAGWILVLFAFILIIVLFAA